MPPLIMLSREQQERLSALWNGKRIRLVHTSDPYTDLKPGDEGVVMDVDSAGTVHIRWDNGSTLGMIPGEDRIVEVT